MKRFTLTPLAAALISISAVAAEDTPKTFTLDKVTVAATLNEQKISDVANTVSVIDSESIERKGSKDVRQLLRYEPGVEVAANGNRFGLTSINIRGTDQNQVKIVIDGIDQAKVLDEGAGYFQSSGRLFIDMDSLKQVEVVKGPASSLYGSNAIGGVVAFTTKDPSDYLAPQGDDTSVSMKAAYSSVNNGKSGTLTVANRIENLESLLVYTQRDSEETENYDDGFVGGLGDSRTKQDPSDVTNKNILAKLQYQLTDAHRIGITFEDYDSKDEGELFSKSGIFGSVSYDDYFGDNSKDRSRLSFSHSWQAELALFDTLEWSLAQQETKTHNISSHAYDYIPFPPGPADRVKDYSYEEDYLQLSINLNKSVDNHQITYGLSYEKTEAESETNTFFPNGDGSDDESRYLPLTENKSYGLFIQDQISLLNGDLTLTPSVRYDKFEIDVELDDAFTTPYEGQDNNNLSLRLGAVYDFTENVSGFAQYAQGFKTPDLQDLYHDRFGHGYSAIANPDLKPEESNSYEAGLRLNHTKGNIEVAIFYNDYDNYIQDQLIDEATNTSQARNVAEAYIKGIEIRGGLWLDDALGAPTGTSFNFAIAYAKGEGKNDTQAEELPLEAISPLKGVLGLNYDSPDNRWGGSIDWTLVDEKKDNTLADESDFAPHGYGLVDLSAYVNITDQLSLRANINNLTDKKYWLYEDVRGKAASTTYLDRYTQPGRNFNISATYTF